MKNPYKLKKSKDKLEGFCDCLIEHKGIEEPSIIFCDKIEYRHIRGEQEMFGKTFDHHLMFWKEKDLVFKVYLPNEEKDKEFSDIFKALKSVGIKLMMGEQ